MFKVIFAFVLCCQPFFAFANATDNNTKPALDTQIKHTSLSVKMDDGIQLQVVDWGGTGPAMIWLAGLSLNAHTFDYVAPRFTDDFRVIGITRTGHGASDTRKKDYSSQRLAKDIIQVLDHLSLKTAIFVGHSFAGGELTELGRTYPNRVLGLIYIDALQDMAHMYSHVRACPDVSYTSIDSFEHKAHFYQTQRIKQAEGGYMPFADLTALGLMEQIEIAEGRDYTGIPAPAIAINHIPEQTNDFFYGVGEPSQTCIEEINRLTYLGVAKFIKQKDNADVAAVQNSQHMIHMATPDKLVDIMRTWLNKQMKNR